MIWRRDIPSLPKNGIANVMEVWHLIVSCQVTIRKSGGYVQGAGVLTKLHQTGGLLKVRVAVNAQIEPSGPFAGQTMQKGTFLYTMQMNLLRKVSLHEFRAASSSDAVKPMPCVRIGFGRVGACAEGRSSEGRSPEATAKPTARARAGHRRTTRLESSVRNLGDLAVAKARRGVG